MFACVSGPSGGREYNKQCKKVVQTERRKRLLAVDSLEIEGPPFSPAAVETKLGRSQLGRSV